MADCLKAALYFEKCFCTSLEGSDENQLIFVFHGPCFDYLYGYIFLLKALSKQPTNPALNSVLTFVL